MTPCVKRESDDVLQQSIAAFESTGDPQRNFDLLDYRAATWPHSRSVVVKCEVQAAGANRRAVVANRPGAKVLPGGVYDEYVDRDKKGSGAVLVD